MQSFKCLSLLSRCTSTAYRTAYRTPVPIYRPLSTSSPFRLSTPASESAGGESAEQARIRQMQDYFSQYIEEYEESFEEAEGTETQSDAATRVTREREKVKRVSGLIDVVALLHDERAQDIVVIDISSSPIAASTMIICSPFNSRHGAALAETLRRNAKGSANEVSRRQQKRANGWFSVELGDIVIHVLDEDARSRFDLESLWGVEEGEEKDDGEDDDVIPPPRQ